MPGGTLGRQLLHTRQMPPVNRKPLRTCSGPYTEFKIFLDGDEDNDDIADIMESKAGLLYIFWTFTVSLHLHKNETLIRTYIVCNITFVKLNTFNTLLKIAVPWVNTELLHVTKPI